MRAFLLIATLAVLAKVATANAPTNPVPGFGTPFNGLIAHSYDSSGFSLSYLHGIPEPIAPAGVAIAAYDAPTNQLMLNLYDSTGTVLQDFNYWNATGYYFTIGPASFLAEGITPQVYQANLAQILLSSYSFTTSHEIPFIIKQGVYVGAASDPTSPALLSDYFTVEVESGVWNGWTFTEPFCAAPNFRILDTESIQLTHLNFVRPPAERFEFPATFGTPSTDLSSLYDC